MAKKLPFFHTKSQTGKNVPFFFCHFFAENILISEFWGGEDGGIAAKAVSGVLHRPRVRGYGDSVFSRLYLAKEGRKTAISVSSCRRHEIPVTLHKRSAVQGTKRYPQTSVPEARNL